MAGKNSYLFACINFCHCKLLVESRRNEVDSIRREPYLVNCCFVVWRNSLNAFTCFYIPDNYKTSPVGSCQHAVVRTYVDREYCIIFVGEPNGSDSISCFNIPDYCLTVEASGSQVFSVFAEIEAYTIPLCPRKVLNTLPVLKSISFALLPVRPTAMNRPSGLSFASFTRAAQYIY